MNYGIALATSLWLFAGCSDDTSKRGNADVDQGNLQRDSSASAADAATELGGDFAACAPSGAEVCDGLDNDCLAGVDDGLDCVAWSGKGTDGTLTTSTTFDLATELQSGRTAPLAPSYKVTRIDGQTLLGAASTPGVAEVTGVAAGDEVLIINLRGSDNSADAVGNWETAFVDRVDNDTAQDTFRIQLRSPLSKTYGAGANGEDLSEQTVAVIRIPQLDSLTVADGGTLTTSAFDAKGNGTGVIFVRARTLVVESGGVIDGSHRGYSGASWAANSTQGHTGESLGGRMQTPTTTPPTFAAANFGAGVGGRTACGEYNCQPQQTTGPGGGGASYGTTGTAGDDNGSDPSNFSGGMAGATYGDAQLSRLFLGSGGGGGGGGFSGPGRGTPGGNGGALIVLIADSATINGQVRADGQIGSVNANCGSRGSGGGGGGSGGTVWISASTLVVASAAISAIGGPVQCNGGGAGGQGRVRLDYATINGEDFGSSAAGDAANAASGPSPGHTAQR